MVTKGLTKKQQALGVQARVIRINKTIRKQLEIQHHSFEKTIIDDCYIGDEPWIDYFEDYYLAEYNSFSKPFKLTRRIKEFKAGKKIIYDYQVVYKGPKGRNAPSPVREYLKMIDEKIDAVRNLGPVTAHLKKHIEFRVQEKHIQSLRNYIRAKKEKGEIE